MAMIKASDAITFEEELSVAPDLSPEDVDLGNRRKPILRAPSSRLEGKVAHASGSRLGRLVRMGNILLEDATLESAGDHVPHSTFLFRRTCLWSVLYLVFCLLLSLALDLGSQALHTPALALHSSEAREMARSIVAYLLMLLWLLMTKCHMSVLSLCTG